ncbi:MAG: N-acetyltransferase [Fibrobacterota bacterium]|nr:N-acetyltransferase [Fibrobacterota bacterium]
MAFEIRDNTAENRFELEAEGKLAFTVYALSEGAIELRHTQVPPELEGKGIGSALAKYALDFAKANNLEAIVSCPFISKWRQRHPG